jgi:predicted RNA binding protein YcfA (HicA-like mRNA interferase family)
MKLRDLEQHLRKQGCILFREGGAHSVWLNPSNRKIASVPRHREIKEGTIRGIGSNLKSRSRR